MSPTVWWILGIIVVLAVVVLVLRSASSRRAEARREEAAGIRDQAAEHDRSLRERQAAADEADAQSRKAQAEADESAARARQLQAETERRQESADEVRDTRDEHLRRADALDPDVRTDKEGYQVDEAGTRVADPESTRAGAAGDGATGDGEGVGYAASWRDGADADEDADPSRGERPRDVDSERTDDVTVGTDADTDADGRPSPGERVRDNVDDLRGARDTDGDGRGG